MVTDGEMRRGSWLTDMADAVEGFVPERVVLEWKGPGGGAEGSTAHAVGAKLRKARKLTAHEVPFLKKNARAPFKVTLPAPSNFMVSSYKAGDHGQVLCHARRATPGSGGNRARRGAVAGVGRRAHTSNSTRPITRTIWIRSSASSMTRRRARSGRELDNAIAGDKARSKDVPRERRHGGDARLPRQQPQPLVHRGRLRRDRRKTFRVAATWTGFCWSTTRSAPAGFEPLRLVPRGKSVVLGLVTTKEPRLESQDELRRRIDEAAK